MPNGYFKPGEQVPTTGIYTAGHIQHRRSHEVFAVQGEQFPSCRRCGGRVRFELLRAAAYIDEDRDFARTESAAQKKAPTGRRPRL
jgi:hypothetical protein